MKTYKRLWQEAEAALRASEADLRRVIDLFEKRVAVNESEGDGTSDTSPVPPKRPGVERSDPPAAVWVRICPWCGGEPLADTDYCDKCDLARHDWLEVRYVKETR